MCFAFSSACENVLYSARRVDARSYLENDVAHGYLAVVQSADVYYRLQSGARVLVENLQSVIGEYAVLVGHRHYVGCYAYRTQVEQRHEP